MLLKKIAIGLSVSWLATSAYSGTYVYISNIEVADITAYEYLLVGPPGLEPGTKGL